MSPQAASAIRRVSEHFAWLCYEKGYGCCQFITTGKVVPGIDGDYHELSPSIEEQTIRVNLFIEYAMKIASGYGQP